MKLNHIDSIRGIAILMVILVHTSQKVDNLNFITSIFSSYGQMGVQLFFVASAYTLCLSATNRKHETHPYLKYTIRRYFRIAPLYYIGLVVFMLFSIFLYFYRTGEFIWPSQYVFKNILSNIFFVHGFYPPANNNIVPGGWSIGTEILFYLVFPFLFHLASYLFSKNTIRYTVIWLISGILLSQIGILTLLLLGNVFSNNSFIYFNIINQLPVFFIGIGYFFILNKGYYFYRWQVDFIVFFVLTIISIVLWQMNINYLFSFIPIISALSFVFLMEIFRKKDIFNLSIFMKFGKASYSMYIIHTIFAHTITGILFPKFKFIISGEFALLVYLLFSVFGTYILALFSLKYIEKPFINFGKVLIRKF